jgi:DNA-directed RNA polymerase specialized sigma24 family protein
MMMADMSMAGDGRAEAAALDRDSTLAALHAAHYSSLVRLACLLLDERTNGEEVVQDAFVRVHGAWARVDDPLTYLRATVMNLARSQLRRRLVARRRVQPVSGPVPSPEEHAVLLSDQQCARCRVDSASASSSATTSTSPKPRSPRRSGSRPAR